MGFTTQDSIDTTRHRLQTKEEHKDEKYTIKMIRTSPYIAGA